MLELLNAYPEALKHQSSLGWLPLHCTAAHQGGEYALDVITAPFVLPSGANTSSVVGALVEAYPGSTQKEGLTDDSRCTLWSVVRKETTA